jgi:hypothetical protein
MTSPLKKIAFQTYIFAQLAEEVDEFASFLTEESGRTRSRGDALTILISAGLKAERGARGDLWAAWKGHRQAARELLRPAPVEVEDPLADMPREPADEFDRFVTQRLVFRDTGRLSRRELREAYSHWSFCEHVQPLHDRGIAARMRAMGAVDCTVRRGHEVIPGWRGVAIVGAEPPQTEWLDEHGETPPAKHLTPEKPSTIPAPPSGPIPEHARPPVDFQDGKPVVADDWSPKPTAWFANPDATPEEPWTEWDPDAGNWSCKTCGLPASLMVHNDACPEKDVARPVVVVPEANGACPPSTDAPEAEVSQ